ncbi:LAETG motif-containing sortase-dependent surface protein [Streptomyces varsoviensis]|uniref:LAETG motif-containing sortase-dependent surface protein n=1 Tax=Streptomyces varsoviensis TaxID=67373 RepID=UPI00340BDFE7
MKLHRALATAVVTTVIGPVVLLAAPAAFAAEETPAAGATPSVSSTATPAPTATATAPTGAEGTPGGAGDGKPAKPATERPTTAPTPTATGSAKPSATPSPEFTHPDSCSPIFDVERGKTGLVGLPSKIVAGSGWHEFTYRVTNVSDITVLATDITLDLGTGDPKLDDVAQLDVTVDWFNPKTGKWKPIEGEGAGILDNNEFATIKRLEPGEYADARMRIKIGEKATPGSGYFFTIGHSYGADGKCGFDEISQFDFAVLKPGSKPGAVDDAKGRPGKPADRKGQGTAGKPAAGKAASRGGDLDEVPVSGKLADTGSSNALPAIAAVGGAAVVAGAGAVFLVRRRKAASRA